ncbi:unnamed protein product [Chilo suppressalis]|uniref:G domain-containing protein n=1 Tax=Chilo suppressalis TaxID=168631 RepID=A0ABN8BCL1_CHISP|nr:unnamed protein product [Chilo suppressalis]
MASLLLGKVAIPANHFDGHKSRSIATTNRSVYGALYRVKRSSPDKGNAVEVRVATSISKAIQGIRVLIKQQQQHFGVVQQEKLFENQMDDPEIKIKVLCLGPKGSGKTTLLKKLQGAEGIDNTYSPVPTIGTNIYDIHYLNKHGKKQTVTVREVGGEMAPLWSNYLDGIKKVGYCPIKPPIHDPDPQLTWLKLSSGYLCGGHFQLMSDICSSSFVLYITRRAPAEEIQGPGHIRIMGPLRSPFADLTGTRDFVFDLRGAPIDRGALGTCPKCLQGKRALIVEQW